VTSLSRTVFRVEHGIWLPSEQILEWKTWDDFETLPEAQGAAHRLGNARIYKVKLVFEYEGGRLVRARQPHFNKEPSE
jgi:hypothetical protein